MPIRHRQPTCCPQPSPHPVADALAAAAGLGAHGARAKRGHA